MNKTVAAALLLAAFAPGCAAAPEEGSPSAAEHVATTDEALGLQPLGVTFSDCKEIASIAPVSYASARAAVPAALTINGDGTTAPFVFRSATCAGVSVDGSAPEAGTIAQLGVGIASPDGTGDLNNYTLWYYTTSARLALRLLALGVPAEWAPRLTFAQSGTTVTIDAKVPSYPQFHVTSTIVEPAGAPGPFTANWWRLNGNHLTRMGSSFPQIRFGGASTKLTTPPGSALGKFLGSGTISSFPFFESFNRFPDATMQVTVSTL
ncbi:MAG: hypothetical protein JWP97_4112 [Labilithrix sp.]|nr:hypothetical protein [Labilithrix sp.]